MNELGQRSAVSRRHLRLHVSSNSDTPPRTSLTPDNGIGARAGKPRAVCARATVSHLVVEHVAYCVVDEVGFSSLVLSELPGEDGKTVSDVCGIDLDHGVGLDLLAQ